MYQYICIYAVGTKDPMLGHELVLWLLQSWREDRVHFFLPRHRRDYKLQLPEPWRGGWFIMTVSVTTALPSVQNLGTPYGAHILTNRN